MTEARETTLPVELSLQLDYPTSVVQTSDRLRVILST